jgi:DNA segregation ATPase FtsK/SpoIIIE-like protein
MNERRRRHRPHVITFFMSHCLINYTTACFGIYRQTMAFNNTTSITAVYTVVAGSDAAGSDAAFPSPSETFSQPVTVESSVVGFPVASSKKQHLAALASSLAAIQDSINTSLTEILVQQGVLDATGDNTPEKNKVRTKVPGQPNNSKKGQTKRQQQREQQQQQEQQRNSVDSSPATGSLESTTASTAAVLGSESENVTSMDGDSSSDPLDRYKPKGGIYDGGEEEELDQYKDEIDLVMEADPGEVDGACLELPKEGTTTAPPTAKKRSGVLDHNKNKKVK